MIARALGLLLALAAGGAAAQSTLVDAARNADHAAAIGAARGARRSESSARPTARRRCIGPCITTTPSSCGGCSRPAPNVAVANDYGATPMSEAAVAANPAVLAALLDAGADVDSPNADGQTALMVVARGGNTAAAELLIERGADVNAREQRKGQTALMWAVAQSHPAMVELLIEHGAEVDARSTVNDWERMVTAEPRQKNLMPGGFTPLLYAARQGLPRLREVADRGRRRRRPHGPRRRDAADQRDPERALRHGEVPARSRRERQQVGLLGPHAALSRRRLQHVAARRPAGPSVARRHDEPRR